MGGDEPMNAAREAELPDVEVGALLKDKWRIDALLGRGGMATVYAATHRNGMRVAIKILHRAMTMNREVRERFLREGYVANAVGHSGAVKVLDDDVTPAGDAFLVMELLEGESLDARQARLGGVLPSEEIFAVGEQLLGTLAAAHQKGIVHRDIKPENLFLTKQGTLKILDFGIAQMRIPGGLRTKKGLLLGTPDFMAPEQTTGSDGIDARTDLWSVGATLFMLAAGEPVHVSTSVPDYIARVNTQPARALSDVAANAPAQLTSVLARALRIDKAERWQSATAMQKALRAAHVAQAEAAGDPLKPAIHVMREDEGLETDPTEFAPLGRVMAPRPQPSPPLAHVMSTVRMVAAPPQASAPIAAPIAVPLAPAPSNVTIVSPPPPAFHARRRWIFAAIVLALLVAGALWFLAGHAPQMVR